MKTVIWVSINFIINAKKKNYFETYLYINRLYKLSY